MSVTTPWTVRERGARAVPPHGTRGVPRRFASMDDLIRALTAAIKGEPLPARLLPPERAAGGATEAQRYSTQEVREVLAKAVEQQEGRDARLGFADLLAIAHYLKSVAPVKNRIGK